MTLLSVHQMEIRAALLVMFVQKNGIDYIMKENADIVALQETKCDRDKLPEEVKLTGYHHYFIDSKNLGSLSHSDLHLQSLKFFPCRW